MAARKRKAKGPPSKPSSPSGHESEANPTKESTISESKATSSDLLSVVGIGASAGGLDALKKLFGAMPEDPGLAFVAVPHLSPTHESLMVELLAQHTTMPVVEVEDGMPVERNCVFVIPPNNSLIIRDRTLYLSPPPETASAQTAIDSFFRSLAQDVGERAIGIVLSGTGSHGTLGIQAIKGRGGMIMVQDPATAEHDRMPVNAIATGLVDYVLSPEAMPAALIQYVTHARGNGAWNPEPPTLPEEDYLTRILALIRARTSHNFSSYRKNMLLRRVQRRMGLCHIEHTDDYITLLRENPEEITLLIRDVLIGVTSFFREPEVFQVLEQDVIPQLLERTDASNPLRVWTPGCSTGEETYSLTMLLIEQLQKANRPINLQIFATDIDEAALETARQGIYPESIAADVSPERLNSFFTREDHHYQVNKQIREPVVLATQNLISDAPFSRLDLISCRNLLIYLEPEVQQKLIPLFHFALKPDGFLLLGSSESIGRREDLFETVSRKWRIFRRVGVVRRDLLEVPIQSTTQVPQASRPVGTTGGRGTPGFVEVMEKAILADYAPASVLINRGYEILCVQGPLVNYLEFPSGELSRDLMSMVRAGLSSRIRAACHRVSRENQTVIDTDCQVRRDSGYVPCTITVKSIPGPQEAEGLMLITFVDRIVGPEPEPERPDRESLEESRALQQLEDELKATREDLQSTIEEMESTNEELKASHEEAMSMNEELQSTNEELETSKEELQSVNEELTTVNSQLRDKLDELEKANNDMANLFANTDVGMLFLDTEMRIRRFTPSAGGLLQLISTDVGRPFGVFSSKFHDDQLIQNARQVLETLTPIEKETVSGDRYWILRIVPYRAQENRIEGVVITFLDITEHQRAQRALQESEQRLALATEATGAVVWDYDLITDTVWWDQDHVRLFGNRPTLSRDSWQGWTDHVHPEDRPRFVDSLKAAIEGTAEHWTCEYRYERSDGIFAYVLDQGRIERDDAGQAVRMIGAMLDVTEQKRAEETLRRTERLASLGTLAAGVAHELNNPLAAIVNSTQAALSPGDRSDREEFQTGCLTNVMDSANRCSRIVQDLLKFARQEPLEKRAEHPETIVQRVIEATHGVAEAHNAQVEVLSETPLPQFHVNALQIEQALVNLILNAIEANDQPVHVKIRLELVDDSVVIHVQDDGHGIDAEELEHAFEPFYSTRHEDGGTGLGLSIVHGIIKEHGGSVGIEGSPGAGVTITITLPVEQQEHND